MNSKQAKILRKLFLDGMTGMEDRQSRQYELVQHIETIFGKPNPGPLGGFVILNNQSPRGQYQMAKKVFDEATRTEQAKMIREALEMIRKREMVKVLPKAIEPGAIIQ